MIYLLVSFKITTSLADKLSIGKLASSMHFGLSILLQRQETVYTSDIIMGYSSSNRSL